MSNRLVFPQDWVLDWDFLETLISTYSRLEANKELTVGVQL
jgi:hypothetical protein